MIYGYIRVSTDKQITENQRFDILKFADEKKLSIDRWIEETVSSTKKLSVRKLGALIERMHQDDILIVSELSRLGRSLLEVMSILHTLMEKEVKVFTTKERYELGNNISSKVLAFAFSLSAEIERSMISSRTKEALARKMRIPVIPATQSDAKLPPNPEEACHPIRTKAAPQRSPIGAQRRLG